MSGLGASLGLAVWVYQLPRCLGVSNGCVRLGVLWRFCRPVVMVFMVVMGVAYIFSDQRVNNHVHVALYHLIT